jgi:integrase
MAKSKQRVELSEVAVAALRWHRKHFPSTSGLVFTTDGRSAIWKRNFAQRVLDPVLEMAGVRRVVFRELRHTVNSLLLEKGVSRVVPVWISIFGSVLFLLIMFSHLLQALTN